MEPADGSGPAAPSGVSYTQDGSPGCYTLRELIRDIPLSTDDDGVQAYITCVDAWNGNLYIGTSSGEVLHFVSIPPDPSDKSGQPSYIFATKIEPKFKEQQREAGSGVKQILLMPNVDKACIVCNHTLTFYTLPELSPAFDEIQQGGCQWVGGLDRNENTTGNGSFGENVVVICLRQRLRLIRVAGKPAKIGNIEVGGISAVEKRGDIACVADGQTYSLLDVVNQRKIDLFSISSSNDAKPSSQQTTGSPTTSSRQASRSFSSHSPVRQPRSHQRNISLGGQPQRNNRLRPNSNSPWPARTSSQAADSPAEPSSREESPNKLDQTSLAQSQSPGSGPGPGPGPAVGTEVQTEDVVQPPRPLRPNIASPTPNEFLLTTGTKLEEPGVGIFVNLEGDVVRGTIEFSSYPESLVLDSTGRSMTFSGNEEASSEGYVIAVVQRSIQDSTQRCIEIQRWDADPSEAHRSKEWLVVGPITGDSEDEMPAKFGLRNASTSAELSVPSVTLSLRLRRLRIRQQSEDGIEVTRNDEEDRLAARFAQVQGNVLFFSKDSVSWVVQTPLIARLDGQLNDAVQHNSSDELAIDIPMVQRVVNSIRGQDARDELEFLTLTYVRQKAALLLFGNLILQTAKNISPYEHDKVRAEDALISAELDPRVVLALIPPFDEEIAEGVSGIWMAQGLRDTVDRLRESFDAGKLNRDSKRPYGHSLLSLIKRYLMAWRKKKGFGSVADEAYVFQTVDAALLRVLLILDQDSPRGEAVRGSVRAELNHVVDNGVDCFERAVELFEHHHRLYMLSRLYQSRKISSQVLATWKRILEGEHDAGGELEGEQRVRKYLSEIRDPALVQEYGSWLACRNPKLGAQVFADDSSRVRFQPTEAVAILKENAPGAVKDFLEHLVFGKNHVQYVNDLIAFYLDTVLSELESSQDARQMLVQSYETYRALHPPKPTYRDFITDNAIDADWWQNRLRLLQLIGGSHGAASNYDEHALRARLAPYSNELVPEMIILNGREGKHEEALRLLTHGLGDYDTAIRYCLLGGSSIFHPTSSLEPAQPLPTRKEQSRLFEDLLNEFFKIDDWDERLERTAELLERFGGWFDIAQVLDLIPGEWSVARLSAFLEHAFRRLVVEKNETMIVKALCSAQNLRQSVEFAEKVERFSPVVVHAQVDV